MCPYCLAGAVRKRERHGLAGVGGARPAIKGNALSFDVDGLGNETGICHGAASVGRSLQIKLYCAVTNDRALIFSVLAALRPYDVMAVAEFSEDGDLHVLENTGITILEVG